MKNGSKSIRQTREERLANAVEALLNMLEELMDESTYSHFDVRTGDEYHCDEAFKVMLQGYRALIYKD